MSQSFGPGSPKSFHAYPRGDFDLESGSSKKTRRAKNSQPEFIKMIKSVGHRFHYLYKVHPSTVFLLSLVVGFVVFFFLAGYGNKFKGRSFQGELKKDLVVYPYPDLRNLVMVAGHSVYTSTTFEKAEGEDSWFLESYQKHPGQAATFLQHIKEGVEVAAKDKDALLLFSGGETRKDAGPRSEAQSYWSVAESKGWFGNQASVRSRALTEEHARDSFENLLFSVCRFRELTGQYPQNITVVSYDFKKERFAGMHRAAIGFPQARFFYVGTPASSASKDASRKGEALARAQFQQDPYGCMGNLFRKELKRDPFHRSVPYPNGCPELRSLFVYCGPLPYPNRLPWS